MFCWCFRHEYQIFQKITKLEYEFPEGFSKVAKDLVEKLLVSTLSITGIIIIIKLIVTFISQWQPLWLKSTIRTLQLIMQFSKVH